MAEKLQKTTCDLHQQFATPSTTHEGEKPAMSLRKRKTWQDTDPIDENEMKKPLKMYADPSSVSNDEDGDLFAGLDMPSFSIWPGPSSSSFSSSYDEVHIISTPPRSPENQYQDDDDDVRVVASTPPSPKHNTSSSSSSSSDMRPCPLCQKMMPTSELQAHVEEELDASTQTRTPSPSIKPTKTNKKVHVVEDIDSDSDDKDEDRYHESEDDFIIDDSEDDEASRPKHAVEEIIDDFPSDTEEEGEEGTRRRCPLCSEWILKAEYADHVTREAQASDGDASQPKSSTPKDDDEEPVKLFFTATGEINTRAPYINYDAQFAQIEGTRGKGITTPAAAVAKRAQKTPSYARGSSSSQNKRAQYFKFKYGRGRGRGNASKVGRYVYAGDAVADVLRGEDETDLGLRPGYAGHWEGIGSTPVPGIFDECVHDGCMVCHDRLLTISSR
eukprot:TRINITY_DN6839_c0_g1_i3.p1 TRINITY_DN6839_c0_g1~~TRINITY_DN6839_c0_g1_i3.p1  ORF type:complete len:443 (+),score=92.88 TRINITY_DN6839_c0_g1_i3:1211-2539(+)